MKVLRLDTFDLIGDYDALYDQSGYETGRCGHASLSDVSSKLLGESSQVFKWIDRD